MSRRAVVPLVLLAAIGSSAPAGEIRLRALPGAGSDDDVSPCVAADPAGRVWIASSFEGEGSLDGVALSSDGGTDVLIATLDTDGRCVWAKLAGGPGLDTPVGLAVDPSGAAYVAGRIGGGGRFGSEFLPHIGRRESFLARYGPDGRCLWATKVPGQSEESVAAVAVDRTGAAVVAGTFVRQFSKGGAPEIYVARYGRSGDREWMRREEGAPRTLSVAVDDDGRVYLARASPGASDVGTPTAREEWPLVSGYDAAGGTRWHWEPARRAPAEGEEESWGRAVRVVAAPQGGCWVLGEVRGLVHVGESRRAALRDRDLFLARLNAGGMLDWLVRVGGPEEDTALGLAPRSDGSCIVTGAFRAKAAFPPWEVTSAGPEDLFLAVYDGGGNCLEVRTLSGTLRNPSEELRFAPAAGPSGTLWAAGRFRDRLRFGDLELTHPEGPGCFLLQLPGEPAAP